MFCPKCGAANEDTNRFCQNCSQPLAGDAGKKAARHKSPLKIILGVLALLIVMFVLYAALSPDDPSINAATSDPAVESSAETDPSPSADAAASADADAPSDSSAAIGETGAASAAPTEPAVIEVGDILSKDIFDWNAASDKDKEHMAFGCQMYWQAGGMTGPPIDDSSSTVAAKISENLGEQGNVFEAACKAYGIDPSPWTSTSN